MSDKTDLNALKFSTKDGFNARLLKLRYEELRRFYVGTTCLELGSSDGEGTKELVPDFERIVAVDGSSDAIETVNREIQSDKVEAICSFFEDLELDEKFETVLLTHILEHVDDPVQVLNIAKQFVTDDGVIIVDVPNARSFHQIGRAHV